MGFQSICTSVLLAAITAATGIIWAHQTDILHHDKELARLRVKIYRQQIQIFEQLENHYRAEQTLVEMRKDDNGKLDKADRTRLNYLINAKEALIEMKGNFVEEHKHEGNAP